MRHRLRSQGIEPCFPASCDPGGVVQPADCLSLYLGHLGPAHGMRAVDCAVEPSRFHPSMHQPSILTCRNVQLPLHAAREEIFIAVLANLVDPIVKGASGGIGDLELNWPTGLLLDDSCAFSCALANPHIANL